MSPTQHKTGLPPGTLTYVGPHQVQPVRISVIRYSVGSVAQHTLDANSLSTPEGQGCLTAEATETLWVNVDGIHDVGVMRTLGNTFGIDELILEDMMNTRQRPKLAVLDNTLFFTLKMIYHPTGKEAQSLCALPDKDETEKSTLFVKEQVSFVLKNNVLLSFQQNQYDLFEPVRERIKRPIWREKQRQGDYLLYALLDMIVDHYFVVLDTQLQAIDDLEEVVLGPNASQSVLVSLHQQRQHMLTLKRAVWPFREAMSQLLRVDMGFIQPETQPFLNDLYDHVVQVIDVIETGREMLSGLMEMYLSAVSNRLNEIMKVLAIFAAVFNPLTFIVGIYGMNFDTMPELHAAWGYPAVMALMLVIALAMVLYFKRKQWL